jgi:hypothetical protein
LLLLALRALPRELDHSEVRFKVLDQANIKERVHLIRGWHWQHVRLEMFYVSQKNLNYYHHSSDIPTYLLKTFANRMTMGLGSLRHAGIAAYQYGLCPFLQYA